MEKRDDKDEDDGQQDDKPRGQRGRRTRRENKQDEDANNNENATEEPQKQGSFRRRRAADVDEEEEEASKAGGGGGWMESPTAKPTQKDEEEENSKDDEPVLNNKRKHLKKEEDEIVDIPLLEEDGGAEADQRVAHAPRNLNRKIPTRAELDSDLKAALPTLEGGFDLSVLLGTLVPPDLVAEDDTLWSFESLIREVTDELATVKPIFPGQTEQKYVPNKRGDRAPKVVEPAT